MIVSCPSCQKRYLVDESAFSEQGSEVRCGICSTTWVESLKPASIPISTIEIDTVLHQSRVKKKSKAVPGLFLFLTLLTILITSLYMARFPLLKWAPNLKPLFEAVGIHSIHPTDGLSFGELTPLQTKIDGHPALVVKGALSNSALEAREITDITLTVFGSCQDAPWYKRFYYSLGFLSEHDRKCPILQWKHNLSQSRLLPGETLAFETLPKALKHIPLSVHVDF
jgi:predicted Zn finger-like uncharacterized protein